MQSERWDLRRFLDAGNDYLSSWSVVYNYRTDLMEPGDLVIFWVSGSRTGRLARGVWGVGYVTGYPRLNARPEETATARVRARSRQGTSIGPTPKQSSLTTIGSTVSKQTK